jgi:hypothetical protein
MARQKFTPEDYDRLRCAGCPVLLPMGALNAPKLELWQAEHCWIEEVQHGTRFMFELALRVISPCCIERFDLTIPGWNPELFRWLTPDEYHLKSFPEYPVERILNSVADAHKKLETGTLLEGVLLGFAPGEIPKYYMSPLTVTISVCDTLKNVTSVDCEAGIHRLQIPRRSAQRQSLFDDNIVRDESGQPVQWLETPQRQQPVEPEED